MTMDHETLDDFHAQVNKKNGFVHRNTAAAAAAAADVRL